MGKSISLVIVLVMLVMAAVPGATAPATAQTPAPATVALDPALVARIEALVQDTLHGTPIIPGIGLGIIKDGQIVYEKGFGVASTATGRPVTPESVYLLASISKTATAIAIMQLVAQGKIDLDAPVVKYLPYFRLASDRHKDITIRHLLSHRAGLNYGRDEDEAHYRSPSLDDGALERWVRGMAKDSTLWQAGKGFFYSDLGFEILGDVIAKVSGQTYEAYVQDHIFTPLGMKHTTLLPPEVDPQLLAAPHHVANKDGKLGLVPLDFFPYSREHGPSAAMCSNVDDLLRYALAQLNHGELDGARILPASAYDEMWAFQPTDTPSFGDNGIDYGLGWSAYTLDGHRVVGHGGGEISYNTSVYVAPDEGIGVVMLGNEKTSCEIENAAYRVMAIMLGVEVEHVSCCG